MPCPHPQAVDADTAPVGGGDQLSSTVTGSAAVGEFPIWRLSALGTGCTSETSIEAVPSDRWYGPDSLFAEAGSSWSRKVNVMLCPASRSNGDTGTAERLSR